MLRSAPACGLVLAALVLAGCLDLERTEEGQADRALDRAERTIAAYRQGDATVQVAGRDGRPATGARLRITQAEHEFRFGSYLFLHKLPENRLPVYTERFRRLFNYATVSCYWDVVEGQRGRMYWERLDGDVALGAALGLPLKGHPLVWGADPAGAPKWLPRDPAELSAVLKRRVQETIGRYRGRVSLWDVVNEPVEGGFFAEVLGDSVFRRAFEWAREADPAARLVINEYDILSARSRNREPYLRLLRRLAAEKTPFDVVGIQGHEPRTEWFDPEVVQHTLDRYAELGKPIHITEFTTHTTGQQITGGYRRGNWTPELQAEYWREFFTVCFGHPRVEAITIWGLDDARAWLPGGGLLDEQWRPKPAYRALEELIRWRWRTQLSATAANGEFTFRGFYGEYEVEAGMPGGPAVTQRFSLRRGARNEWRVVLP